MCPLPSSRRPDSLLLKGGLATRRPGRSASNDSPPEGGPQTGEETVPIYCRYIDIMSRLLLCVDTRSWGQMWGGVVLVVVWGVGGSSEGIGVCGAMGSMGLLSLSLPTYLPQMLTTDNPTS